MYLQKVLLQNCQTKPKLSKENSTEATEQELFDTLPEVLRGRIRGQCWEPRPREISGERIRMITDKFDHNVESGVPIWQASRAQKARSRAAAHQRQAIHFEDPEPTKREERRPTARSQPPETYACKQKKWEKWGAYCARKPFDDAERDTNAQFVHSAHLCRRKFDDADKDTNSHFAHPAKAAARSAPGPPVAELAGERPLTAFGRPLGPVDNQRIIDLDGAPVLTNLWNSRRLKRTWNKVKWLQFGRRDLARGKDLLSPGKIKHKCAAATWFCPSLLFYVVLCDSCLFLIF
jgi:hypothetical protein